MNGQPDHGRSPKLLRVLLMVLPPLVLAVALLWHPTGGEDVFEAVRDDVGAWLFVHVSFLLLAPLLGYAVLLLLQGLRSRAAAVSRAALVVYLVFYTAYEVTAGVGTGVLVDYGKDLPPAEQAVLADAVQDFSGNPITGDPSISVGLGSLGWVVAMIAAAVALRATTSRSVPLLLGVAALFIVHPPPIGPVALVCFAAACVLAERSRSRESAPAVPVLSGAAPDAASRGSRAQVEHVE